MMDEAAARILENYEAYQEDGRLSDPFGQLEEAHTREVLSRYLTTPGMRVYDVGGGTGPYSFWFAQLGHQVHLSDLAPKHVQIAQQRYRNHGLASITVQDARKTDYESGVADLIVLNGPLYHLINRSERQKVLVEMSRLLTDGGVLLAFFITRFSGLNYALHSGRIFDDDYFRLVRGELEHGTRNNQEGRVRTFLEAYFHEPQEAEAECRLAGWQVARTIGIVGPSWTVPNLGDALGVPSRRARLLEVARLMEDHPLQSPKFVIECRKIPGGTEEGRR